ncbi:hypothetical protein [Streptomyces sp. cg35]|uniref:hypothetical protein n=1 Tax=Streptomyces sp. cg35 TaxID=3421650 RepID=UPI003D177680
MSTFDLLTPAEAVAAAQNTAPAHQRIDGLKGVDADRIPNVTPEAPWRAHAHLDKFKDIVRVEWAEDADPGTAEVFYADDTTDLIKRDGLLLVERPILSTREKVEANKARINDETLPIEVRRAAFRLHNDHSRLSGGPVEEPELRRVESSSQDLDSETGYDGTNWPTHAVELWIMNDGKFIDTARNFARFDESGKQLAEYITRLLTDRDALPVEERRRITLDDTHTLGLVADDLTRQGSGSATTTEALASIDWTRIAGTLTDGE